MKRLFGLGVLALSLAGVPTQQAAAESHMKFNFGFNFNYCFEYHGNHQRQCHGCYYPGNQQGFVAVFPEQHPPEPGMRPFPPPPERGRPGPERKQEEVNMQWGYPNLGYTFYHPVSYYAPQPQNEAPPTYYYYAPQYYYAPSYGYPSYYQQPGMSFDR